MAIEKKDLKLLLELREKYPQGGKLAILGDCSFLLDENIDTKKFAQILKFDEVCTFDIAGNPTVKIDLQKPIPEKFFNYFDWVIDSGTLYWCFDVPSVLENITKMIKVGGFVFHTSSLSGFFGRGYYSFQPRFFSDFYKQNGFNVLTLGTRIRTPSILKPKNKLSYFLHRINEKIFGTEKMDWKIFSSENIFLKNSSSKKIEFQSILPNNEPDVLPNNSIICCLATKEKTVPFVLPILKI